jgi:hypothetical protein
MVICLPFAKSRAFQCRLAIDLRDPPMIIHQTLWQRDALAKAIILSPQKSTALKVRAIL